MQPYPGLLIAAARRRIKQAVLARIADRQLTVQQFWTIVALDEHPGSSQSEIAARVRSDAPAVSRALASLLERGLVRADPDPADRRRTCVVLTAAGKRLARQLAPVAREIRDAVVQGMTPAEVASLTAALQRIVDNLDRLAERTSAREARTP
jgi:MarR family transcriptional regulator for hemolysin